MPITEYIGVFFDATPIIRRLWRWLIERNMEVEIKPHFKDTKTYSIAAPYPAKNLAGGVHSYLDLTIINHNTQRPERIIECWGEIRKNRWLFWKRTLARVDVESVPDNKKISNVLLESLGEPKHLTICLSATLSGFKLPRKSELVLIFRMVGPIRKYIIKLTGIKHNQKQVSDILQSKM